MIDRYLSVIRGKLVILDKSVLDGDLNNFVLSVGSDVNLGYDEFVKKYPIDVVCQDILQKHGIKSSFVLKPKFWFSFRNLINVMSENDAKSNMVVLFNLFLLIVLISVAKIPFILVRNIGDSLLLGFKNPIFYNVWDLAIELTYIFSAIVLFVMIFPRWFGKKKSTSV